MSGALSAASVQSRTGSCHTALRCRVSAVNTATITARAAASPSRHPTWCGRAHPQSHPATQPANRNAPRLATYTRCSAIGSPRSNITSTAGGTRSSVNHARPNAASRSRTPIRTATTASAATHASAKRPRGSPTERIAATGWNTDCPVGTTSSARVLPQHIGLDERVRPVQRARRSVLQSQQDAKPNERDDAHRAHQGQVNPQKAAAEPVAVRPEQQPVVEHEERRQHGHRLLCGEREQPGGEHRHEPHPAAGQDVRAVREQREENERGAEEVGARRDIADRLRHERVDGQEHRGREGDGELAASDEPRAAALVVISGRPPREGEEQPDVEKVEQEAGGVVAVRREAPHRVVERVREVHERTLHVVQRDGAHVGELRDRRVLDDDEVVVVDERVGERPPIRHDGEQQRDGAEARGEAGQCASACVSHLYRLV